MGIQVTEKLTKNNYALWRAQVLTAIRGARLEGYITGKVVTPEAEVDEKQGDKVVKVINPAYEEWYARDQQVLGLIFMSVSKDVLTRIADATTAAEAWKSIGEMHASQSRARSVNVRLALATTKKESMSITEYYSKMKGLGDEMAAAGKPLDDEEMVGYIINGLDAEFNPVTSALITRVEPITMPELFSQLLSFETRLDLQQGGSSSSANLASRGRGGMRGRGNNRGRGHNSSRGGRGRGGASQQ